MEITLDAIISLLGLFVGGGGGCFFTWRWMNRRAKAEAKEKEAEAKSAEVDMAQKVQDTYQEILEDKKKEVEDNHRLIAELRDDRDHYKRKADELSDKLDKLTHSVSEWKNDADERIRTLQAQVARNGRQIAYLLPMLCGREDCAIRIPMTITDSGELKTKRPQRKTSRVEPVEPEAL